MFRLKRLEITGFKSFADHTELQFTGEGVTAVVGPNGCGKSNVADAIAWVLGEQRVKHLRGAEMKDVIFQGTRNRAPGGMSEVVLHLVRDETVVEEVELEAGVEDIDHTLEGIDEQSEIVEEKIAAEINSNEINSDIGVEERGANFTETLNQQTQSGDEGTSHEQAEAIEPQAESPQDVDEQNQSASERKSGLRHSRHWRPTRRALDFAPGETVSVTRRLFRSGESEYLLNNRQCRLRDIQDLFSGTGLAGGHYAIIEQGRIGQILSAKPMDRRALVEEAAGITKFRVRQRAAESRLDSARTNLSRVSDIVSEIERQAGSLRRQAAKARRYRQLREELRELLRQVYAADKAALDSLLNELQSRLRQAGETERELAESLARSESEMREATTEARRREEELAEIRAAAADAALQRDRRERELSYQQEQRSTLERQIENINVESESVSTRLKTVRAESETLRARETESRGEAETVSRTLEAAETETATRLKFVQEAEIEIERLHGEQLTHTGVAERLMEIGRGLQATLERFEAQAEGLKREGERAEAAHEEAKRQAEELRVQTTTAAERLAALHSERNAAIEIINEARELAATATEEHARAHDEHVRVRHRLDALRDLDSRRAYYSEAVQRIFGASDAETADRSFHCTGTLADVLSVEPQWEAAVEGVFGGVLQSVIVPTPDDAAQACLWLKKEQAGRAAFLVAGVRGGSGEEDDGDRDGARSQSQQGINTDTGIALLTGNVSANLNTATSNLRIADLLDAPPEILAVLQRTLAREMNARLANNLDEAILRSLESNDLYVTIEGDTVASGQFLSANGAVAEQGTNAGLLAFKREMRDAEAHAAELESVVLFAAETAAAARARVSELEDSVVFLNEAIGRLEREQVARELQSAQLNQEIERTERHMRVIDDDARRLDEERRTLEEQRAEAEREANAASERRRLAAEEVAEAAVQLGVARRAAEVESENLSLQRAAAAAASERRRANASELRRMEAEALELEARLENYRVEIETANIRIAELHRSISETEEGAGEFENEYLRRADEIEAAAQKLTDAREQSDALALQFTELNRQAAALRDHRAALEVQQAEATARLNYLHETCVSELSQTLEELSGLFAAGELQEFDLEANRARVEELRTRLEGFGAVNMMALEELSEAEERLQFLTSQRQDILDGIASTEEALREIKRRSRERFRSAFETINENFGQLFGELFGGGQGRMSLIDEEDVLESGIDIIAQPPGKRLQNVLLLSGGEKAMAALALLLAVFRYRPSPFCLLDEVDAPLDEANIGRFTGKIVEMAEHTQFIVITHNKRTMEVARSLYGVTMEEVGISKLVSVKFE
ncbi:MAG: chromosome segregation protein SMC [Pyrinomonadaceae bacterium]|nr:chromosome segregation protein SMC [Pyrinomonadaceae bacterium]